MKVTESRMSEELKKKLFNYEVIPPVNAWARIADALEEETNAEFPHKLYNAEIAPPRDAWDTIMSTLESVSNEQYPAKLYQLEVAPPVDAWETISGALNAEPSVPAIPSRRKIIPIIRYAVAASLIAFVTFGVFKLLNQKASDSNIAGNTVVPQKTSPAAVQPPSQQTPSQQSVPVLSNNLPKETIASTRSKAGVKRKIATSEAEGGEAFAYMTQTPDNVAYAANSGSASDFQQASLRGDVPGNCPLIADADRYLNFMNPDGSLVRISKKLADAMGCCYNNGTSDEYQQCQEQMKRWRDKLSQSSSAPSADNFMDVLDIIKSAQAKEL
jgi:hypothetical protein